MGEEVFEEGRDGDEGGEQARGAMASLLDHREQALAGAHHWS